MIKGYTLFLIIIASINSDKYQVVYRGPCSTKSRSYCQTKVPNSYCFDKHDECFCKPGFVTVRERHGVVCKPQLSDMKCRVDRECLEVVNSSTCHPGAAICTCPSTTEYIPHENACKNLLKSDYDDMCYRCSTLGGICYADEIIKSPNIEINLKSSCFCPYNTYNPVLSPDSSSELLRFRLCTALKVDLSQYCNDVDVICGSKNSECRYSAELLSSTCKCIDGHYAVYRKTSGFYDCYKILSTTEYPRCLSCIRVGGSCLLFAESIYKLFVKCACNKYEFYDLEKNIQKCYKVSAIIKCNRAGVNICILIPVIYAYHRKLVTTIKNNSQFITVTGVHFNEANATKDKCHMENFHVTEGENVAVLCSDMTIDSKLSRNCGITSTNYLNTKFFGLYLRIWKERYIIDLANDFIFDMTCKVDIDQRDFIAGQVIDRSWTGTGSAISPEVFVGMDRRVHMSIRNSQKIIKETVSFQNIQIIINYFVQDDEYQYIAVEQCSEVTKEKTMIIYQRTFEEKKQKIFFHFQMPNFSEPLPDNSRTILSSWIISPNVSALTRVIYSCVVRLCVNEFWCFQVNQNAEEITGFRHHIKHARIKFITKEATVQVLPLELNQKFVTHIADSIQCHFGSICLTQNQIVILFVLIAVFVVVFFIVLTVVVMKRSLENLNSPLIRNTQSRINYAELNLLPVTSKCSSNEEVQETSCKNQWACHDPLQSNQLEFTPSSVVFKNYLVPIDLRQLSTEESNATLFHLLRSSHCTDSNSTPTFYRNSHAKLDECPDSSRPISSERNVENPQTNSFSTFIKVDDTHPLLCSYANDSVGRNLISNIPQTSSCACQCSSLADLC